MKRIYFEVNEPETVASVDITEDPDGGTGSQGGPGWWVIEVRDFVYQGRLGGRFHCDSTLTLSVIAAGLRIVNL